jgi:hypothetical protein
MPDRIIRLDGVEHRFPEGTTDAEIESALGGQPEKPKGPSSVRNPTANQMGLPTGKERKVLGAALTTGGALLTGGASLPIQAAVSGLTSAGASAIEGDNAKTALTKGAVGAAVPPALVGFSKLAPPIANAAKGLWKGMAKVRDKTANMTGSARATGDVASGVDEIAETVLSRGYGTPSEANRRGILRASHEAGKATGDAVKAAQAAGATIPRDALVAQLDDEILAARRALADTGPIEALRARVLTLPARVPVEQAQEIKSGSYGIYQRNAGRYAAGAGADPVRAAGEKSLGSAIAREMKPAVPGLPAANAEVSKLKPAALAVSQAQKRAGNNHVVSLRDLLAVTGGVGLGNAIGQPAEGALIGGALAAASHPIPQGWMAQRLYDASKLVKNANSPAVRAALLALLQQGGR